MYCLPPDIREEMKANGYLTTRVVEYLLGSATCEAQLRAKAFQFQVGALPVLKRDLQEFKTDTRNELLKQRRQFFRNKRLDRADDIIIPIIQDCHYFVVRFHKEDGGIVLDVHDSLSIKRRKSFWDNIIKTFFDWLAILFKNHKLLAAKEHSVKVMIIKSPQQSGTVDCGLFAIGFVLHIVVMGSVEENAFTQEEIQLLRNDLCRLKEGEDHLGISLVLGFKIPSHFLLNGGNLSKNVTMTRGPAAQLLHGGSISETNDDTSKSIVVRKSTRLNSSPEKQKVVSSNTKQNTSTKRKNNAQKKGPSQAKKKEKQ